MAATAAATARPGEKTNFRVQLRDAAGKPVYLEMAAVNPVLVLPGALAERGQDLADSVVDLDAKIEGEPLTTNRQIILGRVAAEDILDPFTDEVLIQAGDEIDESAVERIEDAGTPRVRIRSVLTCETERGVCQLCYGRMLATGRSVEIGEAVGKSPGAVRVELHRIIKRLRAQRRKES